MPGLYGQTGKSDLARGKEAFNTAICNLLSWFQNASFAQIIKQTVARELSGSKE